jgi:hypothetical protein
MPHMLGLNHAMCHVNRFHVAWLRFNLCATWHGLGLTYVACGMFYVIPCGMWHVLCCTMCHVACPIVCAMWDGLDLAYVPYGMA